MGRPVGGWSPSAPPPPPWRRQSRTRAWRRSPVLRGPLPSSCADVTAGGAIVGGSGSGARRVAGLLGVQEVVLVGVHQGLPARVDDVSADADGAEQLAGAVASVALALDDDAHLGCGLVARVDHADLVV